MNWRVLVSHVGVKVSVVVLMALSIVGVFAYSLSFFNTVDPLPTFQIIDEKKQREFGAFTVKVQTGLFIKSFSTFDVTNNKFVADLLVWFDFNADEITLDTISKFSFDNGNILRKSPPDIRMLGGKTRAQFDVRVEFKSSLNYRQFPLEDHRVALILTNNFVSPLEMFFDVESVNFNYDKDIFIPNWRIQDMDTDVGFVSPQLDTRKPGDLAVSYPQAAFVLNVVKDGIRKVLIIFLPIFLSALLSVLSFLLAFNNTVGRFTLAASALSAILSYRFVIERMLPEVGYFTTTDTLYIALLSLAFVVFVFQLLFTRGTAGIPGAPKTPDEVALVCWYENVNMIAFLTVSMTLIASTIICVL